MDKKSINNTENSGRIGLPLTLTIFLAWFGFVFLLEVFAQSVPTQNVTNQGGVLHGMPTNSVFPNYLGATNTPTPGYAYTWQNATTGAWIPVSGGSGSGNYTTTSISAAGTTTLTSAALVNADNLTLGAGSGTYTASLVLSDSGVSAGEFFDMYISIPASSNPTLNIYDSSTGGTLLSTVTTNGVAGNTTLTFFNTGTSWVKFGKGALLSYQNLADLQSVSTARTNLGLGTAALISSTAGGDLSGTLPSPTVTKLNGTLLSGLASGLLYNTTSTGVPSIATSNQIAAGLTGTTGTVNLSGATVTIPTLPISQGGTGLTTTSQSFSFLGPVSGSGAPTWRAILAGDLPTATSSSFGVVKGDGSTITLSGGVASATTATVAQLGVIKPDGSTVTISGGGVVSVPTATVSTLGLVKVDGSSIIITGGGQISAIGSGGGGTTSSVLGGRNRIINGDMAVNQRGVPASGTTYAVAVGTNTSRTYLVDRWYGNSTTAACSAQQIVNPFSTQTTTILAASNASPNVFTTTAAHGLNVGDQILVSGASGDTTINGAFYVYSVPSSTTFELAKPTGQILGSGGTYIASSASFSRFPQFQYALQLTGATSNGGLYFGQCIESKDIDDLVTQGSVQFSCYMVSSTTTSLSWTAYYPSATDTWNSGSRTVIQSGSFSVTTTPQRFTATINAQALSSATGGLCIEFYTGSGSLASGVTVAITGAQLEPGNASTTFEQLSYIEELSKCHRFCQSTYDAGVVPGTATYVGMVGGCIYEGTYNVGVSVYFPDTFRATPTFSYWDGAGNASKYSAYYSAAWHNNLGAVTFISTGTKSMIVIGTAGALSMHYLGTAEL